MDVVLFKALADETRFRIVSLLLRHRYCVRALARQLAVSEAAVSQHLKILREAGLLIGEKKGHFMHYDVDRSVLHELARRIDALADTERSVDTAEHGCHSSGTSACRHTDPCSDETRAFCHGHDGYGHTCHGHENHRHNGRCGHHQKGESET